jgi:hypothetical protein
MRHHEAKERPAQAGQAVDLQERDAADDARQDERRHEKSADRLGSRQDFSEERISRGDAERERNEGRSASEDQAHADRRQIVRIAQDFGEPGERQPARRDSQVSRLRERRQYDEDHRQFKKRHDDEGGHSHADPRSALGDVAHVAPAQRRASRLDIQITPTAMKVKAKERAAPLGQSRSCMNSS